MRPGPDAFLNQVVGGRWRLLEVLGATGHGTAFRVEAVEDGRPARLELWDQRHVEGRGELARFEREARTLSRLRHEHCLSVVAFGAHEGRPFLVSDLPEGNTLRDALGRDELTVPRAVALGLQLCEGLRHLHRYGVVHRALMPENLWVVPSAGTDRLKIGLPHMGQTTETSDPKRERFYLPTERSTVRPDHRADLYAAGLLLYVMCTGREPPAEVMAAIAGGAPVPPPRSVSPERGISEGLERVVLRAVAPSPDVRFGTADQLLAALQSAGASAPTPKKRPAQRPAQRARRRMAMVGAAFAAIAVLGAGAWRSSGSQGARVPPAVQAAAPPSVPAKAAIEPPPVPPAAMAAPPPIEPKPPSVSAPLPAPPAPIAAKAAEAQPHDERSEILSLLDSGRLDEGAARLKPLVARDPDAAWPRFALGIFYYRKYYRRDSVRQWQQALAQDREIRNDPQFGAYLCFMLDDSWKSAGVTELLNQLGAGAVPLLEHCAAAAKTPRLRSLAASTLESLRGADRRFRR